MTYRTQTVYGMVLVETIPPSCLRCGSENLEIIEDEAGYNAHCQSCYLMHMAFEKHLSIDKHKKRSN